MTTATRLYSEIEKPTCHHEIVGEENRRYRTEQGKDFICARAATINQASIVRAIKAIDKSGVPMVIEISRDGSLCIVPPDLARRGKPVNDFDLDYVGEINL